MNNEHPRLLLWYVSGVIESDARAEIEDHLARCEGCRLEAEALSSMMNSLRRQTRADHVGAADLVSYEEKGPSVPMARRRIIENHLAECGPCREDLRTLARTDGVENDLKPVPRHRGVRWSFVAAAAAALLVVAVAAVGWPFPARDAGPVQVDSVVFAAPTRGARVERALQGTGPWSVRVLLPFGWRAGLYHVVIRRKGGVVEADMEVTGMADEEGTLSLILASLPDTGRYEMSVRPVADTGEPEQIYPFEVLPASGLRPLL